MPTYDYLCSACDHRFEEFQSITAAPLKKCPSCGKPKLKRLIGTGAGILFKGSGFYETDYRSDSYKQAQKKESESASNKPASGSAPAPAPAVADKPAAPSKTEKPAPKKRSDGNK